MTWSVRTQILELQFSVPFHIARPEESEAFRTVAIELERDGDCGLGEAYPLSYYGETVDTVVIRFPCRPGLEACRVEKAHRVPLELKRVHV